MKSHIIAFSKNTLSLIVEIEENDFLSFKLINSIRFFHFCDHFAIILIKRK